MEQKIICLHCHETISDKPRVVLYLNDRDVYHQSCYQQIKDLESACIRQDL